jgi:uncharacterized protein (TIRG00374 family)
MALTVVALIAATVFLYARLGESGFVWSRFVAVLRDLRLEWLVVALPLILAAYVIRAVRWQIMIRPLAPQANLWQLITATFVGFTAVVLFGRAGEPVRPYLIARKSELAFSTQVAAWFVERILDLLMILALFGFSLAQVSDVGWAPDSKLHAGLRVGGWIAGLSGAGCLVALIALRLYRGQIRSRLEDAVAFLPDRALTRVHSFIHAFDEGMQSTRDPASVWMLLILTMVEWALVGGVYIATVRAFPDVHLSPTEVLTTMGFVTFAGVVQIPGVGGGMQIAALLVLTEMYSVPIEDASGLALMLWVMTFLVAVPIGLLFAFRDGIRWRTMRHVGEENLDKLT